MTMDAPDTPAAPGDGTQKPMHAEYLRRHLAEAVGRPITLRMNSNLHTLVRVARDGTGPGLRVSLHRIFLLGDDMILRALVDFITGPTPESRTAVRQFINTHQQHIVSAAAPVVARRRSTVVSRGTVYDLRALADDINRAHFEGALQFAITWGRPARGGIRQHHVTLGTWNIRQGLVRIHPMLDNPHVPEFFIRYIIFHELTHIAVPGTVGCTGRNHHHTREFYRKERTFPEYFRAIEWEQRWLPALIRAWNGGRPLPKAAGEA